MTQILAHLIGDYLLQSHWMAENKVKAWWPALVHALLYSALFALLAPSVCSWLVIFSTHLLIDRYRLARYVVWAKNLLAPWRRTFVYDWSDRRGPLEYDRRYDSADRAAGRPIHPTMSVAPPQASTRWHWPTAALADSPMGQPAHLPAWLAGWLLIIADNTLHLVINYCALTYL